MDRGLTEHLDYFYQNVRLQSVNNKSFTYDNCGNVIRDNRSGLDIAYNFLNLSMQIKSTKDNTVINYNYVADGRKFSALDANKTGLIYIGSLVYRMTGGMAVQFESAGFGDGCFRKNTLYVGGTYVPLYYLKDHLGSPRALCDHTGELMSLRDYYAFGKSWDKPNAPATSDSHYYNGKEEQNVAGSKLLDYGFRYYNVDIGRWLTPDPLANIYSSTSPYAYCLNNPIRNIDPDGRKIKGRNSIDVQKVYESIMKLLTGERFNEIKKLFQVSENGKEFEKIDKNRMIQLIEEMDTNAANGSVPITVDEKAFLMILLSEINSSDVHYIEFMHYGDNVSSEGSKAFIADREYVSPGSYSYADNSIIPASDIALHGGWSECAIT